MTSSMEFLYENSMLSENFVGLDLSRNTLTAFMRELESNREAIAAFMKKFVQGQTRTIVFDTTHLVSQSNKMQLNQKGHNSTGSYDPQVNLLYMFSTDQQSPVYYRVFPGNIHGMSALKLSIIESGVKNACVVWDKRFSSAANIGLLDQANIDYILPLKRNHRFVRYYRLQAREYDQSFDGHFFITIAPFFIIVIMLKMCRIIMWKNEISFSFMTTGSA